MKPTYEQIEQAKEILKQANYIGVDCLFSDSDIIGACENMDKPEPNPDQIGEIIDCINDNFDAGLGINWDSIYNAIYEILDEKNDEDFGETE